MFQIEVVNTDESFLALENDWRDLASRSPDTPYFLTWEFVSLRWKHFGEGRQLWVLIARDQRGTLVGIAPWMISPGSIGPFRIRQLEFLSRVEHPGMFDPYDGENLDVLADPEHRDDVTSALLQHLSSARATWDVADLAWLSPDSSLRTRMNDTRTMVFERTSPCFITSLPADWETYEQTVLGKSEAKRISRHGRRLERDYPGQVRYHQITDRDQIGPAMGQLIEMNLRRWADVGQVTAFDDERHVQFHRDFALAAFDRGWLRFFQLCVGDQVIAANCGVVLHGTYYLFQKGFDPAWRRYGPGNVMQAYEIRQAIEEGCHEYDWAHGAADAKLMWIDTTREDIRLIANNSWRGSLYFGKEAGFSTAKALGRRVLPESTYLRLRQLVLRGSQAIRPMKT